MGEIASDAARRSDRGGIHDPGGLFNPLPNELMAIAARLRKAAAAPHHNYAASQPTQSRTRLDHLTMARKAYALRRKRSAIFGNPDHFGEPACDILLDLFIAHSDGKPVSVSSACIGSAAPATSGLGVLADEGLVLRDNDPEDNRRVMVRLSTAGLATMERFFDAVKAGG